MTLTAREETEVREKINSALTGYSQKADEATSSTEKMLRTIQLKMNESADLWKSTIYDASISMADFWKRQAEDGDMLELFSIKLNEGIKDFEEIIKRIKTDLGLGAEPLPDELFTAPKSGANPFLERAPEPGDLRPGMTYPMEHTDAYNQVTGQRKRLEMENSENFTNYMKDFDYDRFENIMDRTYKNRPMEIIVTIKDETDRGIDATTENANSSFGGS